MLEEGLHIVLNLWDSILEQLPDATLNICSYESFPKNQHERDMKKIIDKHDSITHLGKLTTTQLYDLASKTEYWLYTSTFCETSCITAMEMLMNEVVCLYYPLAALNDTIGDYGIKVKEGQEIQELLKLTPKIKEQMKLNGKRYAYNCSWENRAYAWNKVLGISNKIGIFNSLPFHYEMFGFILNYAFNNNLYVDIFTSIDINHGWIDFYRKKFNNFNIINFKQFNGNTNGYSCFFVATDDDYNFLLEWRNKNIIALNHFYQPRYLNFNNYLNISKYRNSSITSVYPCYPLYNYQDKIQNNTVCIIGGGYGFNYDIINSLYSKDKIKLYIIARSSSNIDYEYIDKNKFNVIHIENADTARMFEILKESSYVLVSNSAHIEYHIGIKTGGSLQLALSTLCKPIISSTSNKYLQLENALIFDLSLNESINKSTTTTFIYDNKEHKSINLYHDIAPINLDNKIDFKAIEEERNNNVDKFTNYMDNFIKQIHNSQPINTNIPKKLFQTWEHNNIEPEFQKIINKWKQYNPDYEYIFHDSEQRVQFIQENFEENVVNAYNKIIPGSI